MTPYQAQRIRFGILAARHALERDRLTPDQADYLEGCEASGWQVKDSQRAYEREYEDARSRVALNAFAIRVAELRRRWMA